MVARRPKAADPDQDPMILLGRRLETLDRLEEGVQAIHQRLDDGDQRMSRMETAIGETRSEVKAVADTQKSLDTRMNTLTSAVLGQAEARGEMRSAIRLAGWLVRNWKTIAISVLTGALTAITLGFTLGWPTGAGVGGASTVLAALVRALTSGQGGPPHAS